MKPPGSHGNIIHQDYNWWQGFPTSCISIAIAIDAADRENGCTKFWPGTHKHGFLHEPGSFTGRIAEHYTTDEPYYLITEPGDVALFHCYTVHASDDNNSNKTRHQIFLSYNDSADGEHYQAHREHYLQYVSPRDPSGTSYFR